MKEISAGDRLPPLADSPQAGAAEALYGLGASIGRRGGEDLALVYLQLALYLEPTHAMALLSLADLYESLKKPDLAIKVYDRIPASSPLRRNAEIQVASDLDSLDRTDEAKKRLEALIAEHPKDSEAIIALGNILRGRKAFRRMRRGLQQGHRQPGGAGKGELGVVLFPRHLLRALQAMAEGRSRSEEGAGAVSRPAAGAQLPRLFLGRPGRQSRRRHEHDPPRRRAAAGRRLHRRLARLGQFPHRQLRRGGKGPRSRRRAQARRSRPSTIISAMPIGGSAGCWRRTSNGRTPRISIRTRKICRRSSKSSNPGCPTTRLRRPMPPRRRRPATAAEACPCPFRWSRTRQPRSI